jgi:hypothetical protein
MIDNKKPINKEQLPAEITTIDQLAQSLANHTRLISDEIIMPAPLPLMVFLLFRVVICCR